MHAAGQAHQARHADDADLERQLDYYTRVVGLTAVAREKNRAILATKPGQEVIVLESWHQERPQRPKVWGDDTPTNYWGPGHPHDMPGPKK